MASLACGGEGGLDVVCWRWGLCLMAHASGLGVDELLTYNKHGQTARASMPHTYTTVAVAGAGAAASCIDIGRVWGVDALLG